MSEADWESFAAEDWQPHVVLRGPKKGQQAWKNAKSGKISYENPARAEKKAKEAARGKADKESAKKAEAERKAKEKQTAAEHYAGVRDRALSVARDLGGGAEPTAEQLGHLGLAVLTLTAKDLGLLRKALGARAARTKQSTIDAIKAKVLSKPAIVQFVPHPNQRPDETTILVDPRKLDADWKKDDMYIPAGGGGAEVKGRRADFENFLATGKPVQASRVGIGQDGIPYFVDGRHRFSVLRDKGVQQVAVTIPKDQAKEIQKRYGIAQPHEGPSQPAQHHAAVLGAFKKLNKGNNFVDLADLRDELAKQGLNTRQVQDAAIHDLRKQGKLSLSSYEGREGITDRQRDSAIREQGTLLGGVHLR